MFMRRSFRSIAYLGIACCLLAGMYLMSSRRRRPRYEYTANNDAFKIRVQMLPETGIGFVLGADYVFASSGIQSDRWHEIMIVHKDDPDPIPRDQIHFLNGDVAYLFMRNKYAVTLNRGANWRVWDITTALPNWRAHRSMIKDIEIGFEWHWYDATHRQWIKIADEELWTELGVRVGLSFACFFVTERCI